MQGADQVGGVEGGLGQVILRAELHRLPGEGFVFDAAEDYEGQAGGIALDGEEGFDAGGIGEVEVEQNGVEAAFGELVQGLYEGSGGTDFEARGFRPLKHFADYESVDRVIFD